MSGTLLGCGHPLDEFLNTPLNSGIVNLGVIKMTHLRVHLQKKTGRFWPLTGLLWSETLPDTVPTYKADPAL